MQNTEDSIEIISIQDDIQNLFPETLENSDEDLHEMPIVTEPSNGEIHVEMSAPKNEEYGNDESDCFTKPVEESSSDSDENMDAVPESIQAVETIITDDYRKLVEEFDECTAEFWDPTMEQIVCGNQYYHHACFNEIINHREKDKSLEITDIEDYQYCKTVENLTVYQVGDEFISCKCEFDTSDTKYGKPELEGFVLDNPDERNKSGEVFYDKCSPGVLNNSIKDIPSSVWRNEYNGCPAIITKSVRNQIFYRFLCVRCGGKIIPVKCWKWWFKFEYDRQKDPQQVGRPPQTGIVEVIGEEMLQLFRDFYETCKPPNANERGRELVMKFHT